MPVEIRELVIRASIPDQPSGNAAAGQGPGTIQRMPDEPEQVVSVAPKLSPELIQSIVDLCLAKLQEQQRDRSFR